VGEIHCSLAVSLCHIGSLLNQGDDVLSGIIRHHSGIRRPLFGCECNNRSWWFACLDAHHCFLS
jgi:hypothetical protein